MHLDLKDVDELSDLAVHPSAQRHGHGSALLRHVLDRHRPVLLWCEQPLVRFYAAHSFKVVHEATYDDEHRIFWMLAA